MELLNKCLPLVSFFRTYGHVGCLVPRSPLFPHNHRHPECLRLSCSPLLLLHGHRHLPPYQGAKGNHTLYQHIFSRVTPMHILLSGRYILILIKVKQYLKYGNCNTFRENVYKARPPKMAQRPFASVFIIILPKGYNFWAAVMSTIFIKLHAHILHARLVKKASRSNVTKRTGSRQSVGNSPSIILRLSEVFVWVQRLKQSDPDFTIPSYFGQLL